MIKKEKKKKKKKEKEGRIHSSVSKIPEIKISFALLKIIGGGQYCSCIIRSCPGQ